MRPDHGIQHCRWAESTLFLSAPEWLQAWDYPWSCRSTGSFRPITDTRTCQTCERWQPRPHRQKCTCGDPDCR
jgi:hypothetical protein